MELWIRSQKKSRLIKVNNILAYDFDDGSYGIQINGECFVGEYTTEERALEVLDEIQNIIKPTLITTQYHNEIKQDVDKLSFDVIMQPVEDKITYIQPNVVIYEMPEE